MAVNVKSAAQRVYQEWNKSLMAGRAAAPPPIHPAFSVEVPSGGKFTVHSWFLNQARPKRWSGKREFNNLSTQTWTVHNDEEYALDYEFERNELEDDIDGLVMNAVAAARSSGSKWAQQEDYLCALALEAGATSTCHDGQNFFDDAHPYDPDGIGTSGTFDNDLTLALNNGNLNDALDVFASIVAEDGMPILSSEPVNLVVPVALRRDALDATYDGVVSTAAARGLFSANAPAPNLLSQAVKVVVNPYLNLDGANPTAWYLTRGDGIVKPIMFQRRRALETYELGQDSEIFIMEKKIRFGGDARHKASYTKPSLGLRSVG